MEIERFERDIKDLARFVVSFELGEYEHIQVSHLPFIGPYFQLNSRTIALIVSRYSDCS